MHSRALGKTGLRTTEIALGTWGLASGAYGTVTVERFEETVARALDAGVRTFDVAPTWGPDAAAERVVARVVGSRRGEVLFVTRAGQALARSGRLRSRFDSTHLAKDCERSLERLGGAAIDVWLLNHPSVAVLGAAETRETAERLVRDGKVRAWGVSTSRADTARAALAAGAQVLCLPHHLLAGDDLEQLTQAITDAGTGVLVRSPLAHGLLAGTWSPEQTFLASDHRTRRWAPPILRDRVRTVAHLKFLVHDGVTSLADAALRWALSSSVVSAAIVGARSPAQISDAARASVDPPYLSDEDQVRVAQVLAAGSR